MSRFPIGTTFAPGEYDKLIAGLRPSTGAVQPVADKPARPGRKQIIKTYTIQVRLPDGVAAECTYQREGPAFHKFTFSVARARPKQIGHLGREFYSNKIEAGYPALEAIAQELAASSYNHALYAEQRDWFLRASENPNSSVRPLRLDKDAVKCTVAEAKARAGQYALVARLESQIGEVGQTEVMGPWPTLDEANAAWRRELYMAPDTNLVVACFCRVRRRYELLMFNPAYLLCDPRPERWV